MFKPGQEFLTAAGLLLLASASQAASPSKQVLRFSVPAGTESPVVIQTEPLASCYVRSADDSAAKSTARMFADQRGYAQFFVTLRNSPSTLTVHCEKGNAVTDTDVELRASGPPSAEYPEPPRMPPPVGRTRPALSEQEASELSDEELIKRGYPLPPDPKLSPEGYELWLRVVTRPAIMVDPGLIVNSYTRHDYGQTRSGPSTSNNWSGVELTGSGGPFAWVSSWWVVPSVTGETNAQTNSSTWVGIDGDHLQDLAQAGTEQDAFGTGNSTVTTFRAWTQLLPNQPTESAISGFTPSPGDTIFTEVWIGSPGGSPSLTAPDLNMVVCIQDLTSNAGACFNDTPLGSTVVGGSEAEWIMERPSECDSQGNNCSPAELANFGNVVVFTTNFFAQRSNSGKNQGYSSCCGLGSSLINTTSDGTASGTALDTVNLNGGTINFVWSAFH